MLILSTFISSLVGLVLAGNFNVHHKPYKPHPKHREVRELDAPRNRSLANTVFGARDLEKRFEGVRLTLYDAGRGACGAVNTDSDYIVALNTMQYGSGGYCYQMITITVDGKTATAQITDECEACPYGGLDLSRGLFEYFAPVADGVLSGSWYFGTTPTTTSSTYVAPSTTSTPTPTPTSSSVVSSFSYSSTSSASAASPSSSPNATTSLDGGVLDQFNLAFVNIGAIALAAGSNLD